MVKLYHLQYDMTHSPFFTRNIIMGIIDSVDIQAGVVTSDLKLSSLVR